MRSLLVTAALIGLVCVPTVASAEIMSLEQAVAEVRGVNPQVRGARFRWESAKHQIIQNYTPADPQFSFTDSDSWRGFLAGSGTHNVTVAQSLQFPGKGVLQGRTAARTAEIAGELAPRRARRFSNISSCSITAVADIRRSAT